MGPDREMARRLCEALENEDCEDLEALLKGGADPNLLLPEGIAPVHLASGKERESALRCLNLILQHGGDPNARSVEELTPLHVAASWGCSKCLKLLLKKGGDPTLEDQDGNRAIDLALEQGNRRCAFILQEYDRSQNHRDSYNDGYLQSEDSTETINLSELSDAGPLNSTRMSLLCSLPGKAQLDNHLSDTVVACGSHLTSFLSDLQESLCHSVELESVGSRLSPSRTVHSNGGLSCNDHAPSLFSQHSYAQRSLPYEHAVNISNKLAVGDIPAREPTLAYPEMHGIALPAIDVSDEDDSAAAHCHNQEPDKVSNGSLAVNDGFREAHATTTLSTTAEEGDQSGELSGICSLGGISKGSLSSLNVLSVVHHSDTVIGRFPGNDLDPKLGKNKGLDVTSPDHVFLFCMENSATGYDLEKTLLESRLSVSRDDDKGLHPDMQQKHHNLSPNNSKYNSCLSECYISVSEVWGYDGSHSECSEENKGDIPFKIHPDSASQWRSRRAGPGTVCGPADVENVSPEEFSVCSFDDTQEGTRGYTTSKENVLGSLPQTSQITIPIDNFACQNGQAADSRVLLSEKKAKATLTTATQDTAPTEDVADEDCGLSSADFDLHARLKAMMLSTNNYKSRVHMTATKQPGQVNNEMVFIANNGHRDNAQGTGSTSLSRTVSQSQDTLSVEAVNGKNDTRQGERSDNLSEQLQHRMSSTKIERESQQRNETSDTLTTDFYVARPASAENGSQATISSETQRVIIATKALQSPLPQQNITPRTKSRVTSSSSRNSSSSSSSLFDDTLEMPQRRLRNRTPQKRCNSPSPDNERADDDSRESQLCQNGGSADHLKPAPSTERVTLSLEDTEIIEEKVACCSQNGVQKTWGAESDHSSPTVPINLWGGGGARSGEPDGSSPTVHLRHQGSGDIGGGETDGASPMVLLGSQGSGGIEAGEPDDSNPSVLVRSHGAENFSDFFTEDQSSSFTDEPKCRPVCVAIFGSPQLISDADDGMSDNTWMTEDGDYDDYTSTAGHGRHSTLNRRVADLKSGVGISSAVKPDIGTNTNRSRDLLQSTLLEPSPISVEEQGSPLMPRYSFSRLSIGRPSAPMPVVNTNLSSIEDLSSFNITLSPGGRPVNTSMSEPVDYLYMDPEKGHALIERHFPCTDDSTQDSTSSSDTILYDWKTYKRQLAEPEMKCTPPRKMDASKILPELYRLCNDDIMVKLREFGENPGPVTSQTRRVYIAMLDKLMKDPQTKGVQPSGYSPELSIVLQTFQIPDCHEDEIILSKQFDQPDKNKKWREGVLKSSFNYMLLDPRVTRNLPSRCFNLSQHECFRTFISAIFYVGKGKRSRPYSHLYEALTHYRGGKKQACQKVQHILDIWQTGQGVVSLHCFQNVIPVEAYTREACMVDAIGLKMLTNQKKGNYYGYAQDWPMKRRRRLGVHMLHRAMQIFLAEGERQLRPADIQIGQ